MLTNVFAPLPVLLASSITKFTCRGMASQHTPKMAAFLGVKNIDWARLQWVAGIMYLLRKIKRIMCYDGIASRYNHRTGWRRNKHYPLHKVTHYLLLALFQLPPYKKSAPESPKVGVPPPCVVPVVVCEECG